MTLKQLEEAKRLSAHIDMCKSILSINPKTTLRLNTVDLYEPLASRIRTVLNEYQLECEEMFHNL